MPTPKHVLAAPVEEGGELVFAHALDSGIRVWMRGLTRLVDERPSRLRGVAAPLYGGTIRDLPPLRDFVADFVEHAVDMSPLHTVGPWNGAAAELLLSRVRGLDYRHIGFFATGLPELPASAVPDTLPAAVLSRERAKHLAEYLEAPAGPVLHHLGRTSHG
ncbi:hypothetical protein ACWD6Q_33620 [Streptomyces nigra]|uniref:hypothetical protein n=1 Tax=Streptomyces nigra TaxID=1827580 RepID=UPI0036B18022